MSAQAKTTVYLDPDDYRRVKALARSQGRTAAELVREAVAEYARSHPLPARPACIAAGRSKRGDVSERAEELVEGMGEPRSAPR
ncbi:MAG: CopG family transcriptional regulator [Gemmatimonadaceae bacterium]